MISIHSPIQSEFEEPILFRTTDRNVYDATLSNGSLWLRSGKYYRDLEDQIRRDISEGGNYGRVTLPLQLLEENAPQLTISGTGDIGEELPPHYILSLHGPSISEEQRASFGGCTFGIKCITTLTAEIVFRCSSLLRCVAYRYGPIRYQYGTLSRSRRGIGAPICLAHNPPAYLTLVNTDLLRKAPVRPFIEQDEWRIVLMTDGYLDGDGDVPLKLNVDTLNFYPYCTP
jgi:hypothetical protein